MRIVALLAAVALGAAACSLPTDDNAQVIAQADLSPSLQQATVPSTSTTLSTLGTRDVAYYLLANREGTEQREVRQVVAPVMDGSAFEAIDPMDTEGFKATIGADDTLLNTVTVYDIVDVTVDDGIGIVFLETLEQVPNDPVLRDVAAQLVWTLTGLPGVEAMRVFIDGEPRALPTTNDGEVTDAPVRTTDYALYDGEQVVDTSSTTTSPTATTTTVPAGDG